MLDVLITNPRLVGTGLNLVDFQTTVFYEIEYSIYTMMQVSRWTWRIGQTCDVDVHFAVYRDTMEHHAASLVGQKLAAAQLLYGDSVEGALVEQADMAGLEHEQMRVVLLNTKNRILGMSLVYQGSLHTMVIRVGELFRDAVRQNAAALIVAHNHPSGAPTPSPEDVAVTREIVQSGKSLDIDVLDHMVIGGVPARYVSLEERGLGF